MKSKEDNKLLDRFAYVLSLLKLIEYYIELEKRAVESGDRALAKIYHYFVSDLHEILRDFIKIRWGAPDEKGRRKKEGENGGN